MTGNQTFTMIKPTAFKAGNTGHILDMIEKAGFRIKALKTSRLTCEEAGKFYAVHRERPFYSALIRYMSSGPIVAAVLEKDDAVEAFRKLIGATNPAQAEPGTIRSLFGTNTQENAVHGSDSDENASLEAGFFFSALEMI